MKPVAVGLKRLSVFLGAAWITLWWLAYIADETFNTTGFIVVGVLPVFFGIVVPWGVWWVIAGFRKDRQDRR